MTLYVRDSGAWKPTQAYVRDAGVWKLSNTYVRDTGTWKVASATDTTPPPAPTLTLTNVANRYFTVNINVGATNVTDLDQVRVLVSSTSKPGTPAAPGFVTTADNNYPNEDWSTWYYGDYARTDSSVVTSKEYPPNPTSTTQLTGGLTYWVSAFSRDTTGNWSAGTSTSIYIPPTTSSGESPSTDGRTVRSTTFYAKWSRSWEGSVDGAIFDTGYTLKTGAWPGNGMMRSAVGFNTTAIQRELTGAEITKVELRLRSRNMYYSTGRVRWRYHGLTTMPASTPVDADFGTWTEIGNWADDTTKWIDITDMVANQWKTGAKTGLYFAALDNDKHRAITIAGDQAQSPPAIRFTYLK